MYSFEKNVRFIFKKHIFSGRISQTNNLCQAAQGITKHERDKSEQVEYLKSALRNDNYNWNTIKKDILSKHGNINQKNIDAIILKLITARKKYTAALSFADHIKTSNEELSLGVINGLLNFYYTYAKENCLTEEEKLFILDIYKHLHDKYKVLDFSTSETLLHALCSINEWQKCLKLIDSISLTSKPSHSAYNTLIGTLFKNNKKSEALKLIQTGLKIKRPPNHYAYNEWIKYILVKYKDKNIILKYLNQICLHFVNNSLIVPENTAKVLQETYRSLGWTVDYTSIKKNSGECSICHTTLDCLHLTTEEFNLLQSNIKEKLIVGSDLLLKTSPEELKKFLDFVEKTKPYDIVIDALNVAYSTVGNRKEKTGILIKVVDEFNRQNKKVLLLGKKHMFKWGNEFLQHISRKTCYFFTDDLSQDDPYFITAAILSGPNTDFVSKDLLRGHRFILKDENLKQIFQRWQWQHQWMVFTMRQKPNIQPPLKFTPSAQQNGDGWHLPYQNDQYNPGEINDGIPDCSSWLCLRPPLKDA